ncbi:MAG TPA: protein-glutamate O-methyltransferase, partial [Desulfohalobiaceae bacterium]|nr:protein-glutamate O-methyltransferase [Desulfohalobiaceae bacterium]
TKEFQRFSSFIQEEFGIKMPPGKKTMLESRLGKRLRALGMNSYKDYENYLFNIKGMEIEIPHLIDAVTTNKTDFFREANHFDILYNQLLPKWFGQHKGKRDFSVWSAGCSSGEEPYTLAIVLNEFAENNPDFKYNILGTDISNEILEKAQRAVYPEDRIEPVPANLKRKYFLRSKDRKKKLVRVVPELRKKVAFRLLNFMDDFDFREKMDAIFCRNVIIYFEKPIQERLFQKFCEHLHPNGYLFIGHSETLAGMNLSLKQLSPTTYQKV